MGRAHVRVHGGFPPERFLDALTDFRPDGHGGTDIDLTIVRVPTTAKGRVLDLLLGLGGNRFFAGDLRRSVHLLESRPDVPT